MPGRTTAFLPNRPRGGSGLLHSRLKNASKPVLGLDPRAISTLLDLCSRSESRKFGASTVALLRLLEPPLDLRLALRRVGTVSDSCFRSISAFAGLGL